MGSFFFEQFASPVRFFVARVLLSLLAFWRTMCFVRRRRSFLRSLCAATKKSLFAQKVFSLNQG